MSRVDVNRVDPSNVLPAFALQHEGVEEAALVEIQPEDLWARGGEEGVAGGEVVCECTAEAGYARAVVEAALRMQLDRAVVLEMDTLGPVIGKNLGRVSGGGGHDT